MKTKKASKFKFDDSDISSSDNDFTKIDYMKTPDKDEFSKYTYDEKEKLKDNDWRFSSDSSS